MKKDCLYHAKKGDVSIIEGSKLMFLRKQTLRDVTVGEFFYGDKDGKRKYVAIQDGAKAYRAVSVAGIDEKSGQLTAFQMRKVDYVWRVRGVTFITPEHLAEFADMEIREDETDSGTTVYDVYEQFEGDSEFHETFDTREDAEGYVRQYRVKKYLEARGKQKGAAK